MDTFIFSFTLVSLAPITGNNLLHIKVIAQKSGTFDIGDSYMTVALLLLLDVTKIQDGGSSKKRIATTKTFY